MSVTTEFPWIGIRSRRQASLKPMLDALYEKYNRRELIKPDPLQFVYRYTRPQDVEIAALLASCLAYGRVEQIEKDLNNLLAVMEGSPYRFVQGFDAHARAKLKNFKHRFTSGDDISDLLELLKQVFAEYGSIEQLFLERYSPDDENVVPALSGFCDAILGMYEKAHRRRCSAGLRYLLPSPADGSPCKRLNLFLRWMVRKDDVDSGLWRSVDKAKLIIPVDVHIARLCRILGFHNHKTASLSTAILITKAFAEIEPADPVKYDFALSRIGITGDCTGRYRAQCELCFLVDWCRKRKGWRK